MKVYHVRKQYLVKTTCVAKQYLVIYILSNNSSRFGLVNHCFMCGTLIHLLIAIFNIITDATFDQHGFRNCGFDVILCVSWSLKWPHHESPSMDMRMLVWVANGNLNPVPLLSAMLHGFPRWIQMKQLGTFIEAEPSCLAKHRRLRPCMGGKQTWWIPSGCRDLWALHHHHHHQHHHHHHHHRQQPFAS